MLAYPLISESDQRSYIIQYHQYNTLAGQSERHYTQNMRLLLARFIRRFPKSLLLPEILLRITRPRYAIGVVGVVFNQHKEALLVEHLFHPRTPWGLPGGWSQHRETPEECLTRELGEELHLSIEIGALLLLERGEGNHLDFAYLCQATSEISHLNGELLRFQWVSEDQIRMYQPLRNFHLRAITSAFNIAKAGQP